MGQTAVEYLDERYTYIKWMRDRDEIGSETGIKWYNEALEQAKQMEKEQIMKAYYQIGKDHQDMIFPIEKNAEQYYNETYKTNEQ